MTKIKYLTLFGLFLLTQQICAAGPSSSIIVRGNERVETETIQALVVKNSVGKPSEEDLNTSLQKLFESGYFSDVKLRQENNNIIVTVVENPIVNQVQIEGNDTVSDEIAKPELKLKPRTIFTPSLMKTDVERLQTIYRLKGHFAAVVTPKIIRREQNRVDVVYEVTEGKATKVSKIFFNGNKNFSDSKLEETIQTKESRWYRFFTSDDNYDPDRLAYDRELLRLFYLQHGYADFKIKSAVAELSPDKQEFFITFTMDEGERYQLGDITVDSKVAKVDAATLQKALKIQKGEWYNNKNVEKTVDSLTNELGKQGYAFVDINPVVEKDKETHILKINFEVQEGPQVYIDQIRILGNTRTDEDVIRRELLFYEGDAFNSDKLKKSERNIKNLGFFKNVKIDRDASNFPDKINITIEVEEDRTGEFSVGGGWSTTDGPLVDVRFAEHNFRGRGQDLSAGVTLAKHRQEFDIGFTEPYFLDRNLAAGIDLFRISQNKYAHQNYDHQIYGTTLRLGYLLAEDLVQQLSYTIRHDEIRGIGDNASRFIKEQKGSTILSEIGQTISYDQRDSRVNPTEGYVVGFSNNLAGVGGDVKYLKNSVFGSYYYPLHEEWILELSGRGNIMHGIGKHVRVVDRYTLGAETLRGFQAGGVGPRDKITKDSLGGLKSYVTSAELIFPVGLPSEFGLKGALFSDAGSVFDSSDPKSAVLDKNILRVSAGAGIRWRSPIGPLRVDVAHAIRKASFDKTQLVVFGLSTRF